MARRAAMTAVLAAVLGLGILTGVGLALPWEQVRIGREARRLADSDRAEQVFLARWRRCAGECRPLAQPLSPCDACIEAATGRGMDCGQARERCGAACGLE
ncbi:MAG: hypothetical protein AB1916_03350 [Thermodesulfobacteriota bacterium]